MKKEYRKRESSCNCPSGLDLKQEGNLESSKKWSGSGYILKEKTIGFVYMVYEKEKVKNKSRDFGLSN